MPVDEDINLDASDGLSQEDIDELKRQADELENIAVKSEKNVETIKKNYKDVFEGKDFKTKDIMMGDPKPLDISKLEGLGELNERMIELEKIVAGLAVSAVDAKDDRKEMSENLKKIMRQRKKVAEAEEFTMDKLSMFSGFTKNPTGMLSNLTRSSAFGFLKNFSVYGLIATVAIQVGEQVYEEIRSQIQSLFKAGGIFDLRKEALDNMKQIPNLDHIIAVNRGEVFFTSDTAEMLRQGAPQNSNTRDRVNGHKQYLQEFDR